MDFGTLILTTVIGFMIGLIFSMLILQASTVRSEERINPSYEIVIDNGLSDTTYIYKFK